MSLDTLTTTNIKNLFHLDSKSTLLKYEEKGEIPKAERVSRGQVSVRQWDLSQIPSIGKKLGFLKPPANQIVICKYIQKGGVLKTTTSFNEARSLALNGIKTLVIGLDSECSITDALLAKPNIETLQENTETLGLYNLLVNKSPIKQIIQPTSLPTLDIISETHELAILEKWINQQPRKEYFFKDKLLPLLQEYEVIIFDNAPSWSSLIENAIVSSNNIVCPLGCTLLAYNAANTNINTLFEFIDAMRLKENKNISMFATLLERTSLSQQIYAQYLAEFKEYIIPIPIRASVKFQEALMSGLSVLEYSPLSSISKDYFDLMKSLWEKINNSNNI